MRTSMVIGFLVIAAVSPVLAQPAIDVSPIACLPNEENAVLRATVSPEIGGASVRLYFRRLNPEGAFYYNTFHSAGDGNYWTVFPKPEDRDQVHLYDDWWDAGLDERDWMEGRDREWLDEYLEERPHELAEYFVAVHDSSGERLGRSPLRLVEILDPDDCQQNLTEHERGWAENLTIGETREDQYGEQVYHWLCDGVVTRIDPEDVIRADEYCRACVVALLPGWVAPTAGALAGAALATQIVDSSDDPAASPSRP